MIEKNEVVSSNGFLKVNDVQQLLNVSRALVYRLIETGELKAVHIRNAIRVRQRDLDEYIEEHLTV